MLKLAENLKLPLDVAGQAIALVGIRGSGKTNTAGVIAEELLTRGQQIVVLDPTDAWWGLRSDYPIFIFGGPHGDLGLNETDGKTLAEFVVQEKVPVILSLRHLRKGAQRRLVMEFCEELYHLKGRPAYREPLTVFIDEAPQFVPQRVTGDMARLVGAVQDMILLGRSSGFGVALISQRFATLNADVRTQADTVIVHRLPSPLDRKALTEWIEENATIAEQKEVLSSLAKLQTGEAWIWAPYFELFKRTQIRARRTFDSSAAPKQGASARAPKDLKAIDLEKLKGKLAATIEKAKADDPRELRKRITDLEKQLSKGPSQVEPTRVEVPVLTAKDHAQLAAVAKRLDAWCEDVGKIADGMREQVANATMLLARIGAIRQPPQLSPAPVVRTNLTNVRVTPPPRAASTGAASNAHLPPGEKATLIAAAQYPDGITREQASILTGYKRSSRDAYIQRLQGKGYAVLRGGNVVATQEGIDALGSDYEPLPTGESLQKYWLDRLPPGEKAVLELAIYHHPKAVDRDEIDNVTGYKRSSRDAYIQRLQARQLVAKGGGPVRASEVLFS